VIGLDAQDALAKTNRINLLFDFYRSLLTDKQRTYLELYFHENYSLAEIAAEFDVSRQAVSEQIRRSEQILEDCEAKLGLLAQHEQRKSWVEELRQLLCLDEFPEARRERVLTLLRKLGGDGDGGV
jgi:hypothetical protein